ncbi:MAG TPA: efflux RND transporter periplasmic adaptor subunit [Thermoanaerobaculia bacterium]|jgi:HlyD family secretion protein|nr:efflux RND transporter periplasmic adaptor subunit [Thermoanaerobaculia bacterium]
MNIMRQKKSFIAIGLVLILSIIGVLVHRLAFAKETTAYRFATIERGNLQSTVSATGTLNAVTTVSVGTQVSGQVSELLADFNDHVKKGQLLARIDPTLALQAVTDAQANLEKSQAQALLASRDYARNRELTNDGLVARSAYEVSQSGATVADAGVKSARVALDRARQNLSYTNIYAPIDGVVVERNVQQGQTVAASLSAPQLFLIANDLSQMQILAQVGESDIAQIKEAQPVSFTVQALTGQTFKGTVKQVRLQSTTTDNVVNYTVVVSVPNADGKLLPGMTARVQFLTKEADNVLKVSNAALRFKPTDAELAALKAERPATATSTTSTTSTATSTARAGRNGGTRTGSSNFGTLYYLDANGKLAVARVKTGLNDGSTTEVTGKTIKEGMKVIAGTTGPATAATASAKTSTAPAASPFQGGQQGGAQRGGGGRGGF